MVPRSVCVPSNPLQLAELALLFNHEWSDDPTGALEEKQDGISGLAVGLCQLPLLQNLPGFGLDGSTGNGAPSTVRDGLSLSFWGTLPLLENFDIFFYGLER